MHTDRPGDRPRLLYWYRTAPGIMLGRSPLDEDAIRTIEDSHPDIDFDWPAILALSEVMTPEDEAPVRPQKKRKPQGPPPREQQARDQRAREPRPDQVPEEGAQEAFAEQETASDAVDAYEPDDAQTSGGEQPVEHSAIPHVVQQGSNRLLEELVGREIANRLRARYAEIAARIDVKEAAGPHRDAWLGRAAPLNPDSWVTPDAILAGVRAADSLFEALRAELGG